MDIAQKPNRSGQILDQHWKIFFAISTKLIPRRIFFCIAKILVLMVVRSSGAGGGGQILILIDVPIRGAQFAADRIAAIRSDLKSHDSSRNPKFRSIRCDVFTLISNALSPHTP